MPGTPGRRACTHGKTAALKLPRRRKGGEFVGSGKERWEKKNPQVSNKS